jgi:putative ABC transport system substrate-binding protein
MKRREFITLLGGAAASYVSWPLPARAQQSERVRRVGVLMPHVQNNTVAQARIAALSQALQQLGWNVGRNLTLEVRYAGPFAAGIRKHAAELVALGPDVILANGSTAVGPLLEVTRTCS